MLKNVPKLILVALVFACKPASGNDFEAAVDKAADYYKERKYNKAKEALHKAMAGLDEKRVLEWMPYFPKPLPGWEAGQPAILEHPFGGEIVKRKYSSGDGNIEVLIKIDGISGMIFSMLRPALLNPELSAVDKEELMNKHSVEQVGSFLAICKEENDKKCSVEVRICDRVTVACKTNDVNVDVLKSLAYTADFLSMFYFVQNGNTTNGVVGEPSKDSPDLIGDWQSQDGTLQVSFNKDMTALWSIRNPKTDTLTGVPGKYFINFERDPVEIDILDLPMVKQPLKAIFKFDKEGNLVLSSNNPTRSDENSRPTSFEDATTFIRLK